MRQVGTLDEFEAVIPASRASADHEITRNVPKLGPTSGCSAVVIVEEAPKTPTVCDVTFRRRVVSRLQDQLVVEPLVIAFSVVVLDIFNHGVVCQNSALRHAARR